MSIGIWQLVLIFGIVMLLFGAGRLPRIMGDLARGIKSFKSELDKTPDEVDKAKLDQKKD
ncbi:MAG: twin-arginine translocase TatA/TatE family subunit [Alphaproteobacteria bacterium]|nr:twin-arginine translocase TatA/TatE family subunit [Alphaproteobacteria bacterium]MDP1975214.1 twin-arginine translocase TatA/TatE family subunit [Alphaproteobacteria bacterium]